MQFCLFFFLFSLIVYSLENPIGPILEFNQSMTLELSKQNLLKNEAFLQINPQNVSKQCSEKFYHAVNRFLNDPAISTLFQYSGKGVNDLGDFQACIKSEANRYVTLSVLRLPMKIFLGICGPAECTQRDYNEYSPAVAKILNETIQKVVPKDSAFKPDIRAEDVIFTDVINTQTEKTQDVTGYWITFGLLFMFLMLSIFAGLYNSIYPDEATKNPLVVQKIINCFDLGRNYKAFVTDVNEKHDPNLKIFDGLRVLCMIWIVYGHSFHTSMMVPLQNFERMADFVTEFKNAHLYNGSYSVDVFFFLSGFFLTFIVLGQLKRNTFTWQIYLHRIIRLYPALIVTYFSYKYILPMSGKGPIFVNPFKDAEECSNVWHYIFLFIWNFNRTTYNCLGWVWYLANDFQFFIVTPPLLWILHKYRKIGFIIIAIILSGSFISTTLVSIHYNLSSNVIKQGVEYQWYYYQAPWARCPVYIIGILFAYLYFQYKDGHPKINEIALKFHNSKILRYAFYIIAAIGLFYTIHLLYWIQKESATLPKFYDYLFLISSRSFFVIFLCILIIPALVGHGSLLRFLLANRLTSALGKLTYAVYLIHLLIICVYAFMQHRSLFLEYQYFMFLGWQYVVAAYFAGFLLYMFIETPLFNLEAEFLRGTKKPIKPKIEPEARELLKEK